MVLIFPTFIFTQEKKRKRKKDPIPQKSTLYIPNTTREREIERIKIRKLVDACDLFVINLARLLLK
jgi:hypothetical protein